MSEPNEMEKAILDQFSAELNGMTVEKAEREKNESQNIIDQEEPWVEALTIFLKYRKLSPLVDDAVKNVLKRK